MEDEEEDEDDEEEDVVEDADAGPRALRAAGGTGIELSVAFLAASSGCSARVRRLCSTALISLSSSLNSSMRFCRFSISASRLLAARPSMLRLTCSSLAARAAEGEAETRSREKGELDEQ